MRWGLWNQVYATIGYFRYDRLIWPLARSRDPLLGRDWPFIPVQRQNKIKTESNLGSAAVSKIHDDGNRWPVDFKSINTFLSKRAISKNLFDPGLEHLDYFRRGHKNFILAFNDAVLPSWLKIDVVQTNPRMTLTYLRSILLPISPFHDGNASNIFVAVDRQCFY